MKFSCFFYDPMDVGNLMSGSSAFSKSSLYIWKFSVLLKPCLKYFEYYLTNMRNECSCAVVWTFFGIVLQAFCLSDLIPWICLSLPVYNQKGVDSDHKRWCCENAALNMPANLENSGQGQFSFQSQRKAMPKNAQTTAQLHSYHMLVK